MSQDVATALRSLRLLQAFPEELLAPLVAIATVESYPAGAVIFRQGDLARTSYLIVEGNVALEICAPGVGCKRILTVTSGELLGWSPVLEQEHLTATARTLAPTRVVAVDGRQILALCEHNPRFGYEFMKRAALALARRLSATRLQLLDVYGSEMVSTPDERAAAGETAPPPPGPTAAKVD
jgi:CRP/FNR family cyclic AMP-dependent transcriptional regulator